MRKSSSMWARAAFYATLGSIIPASAVAGYFIGHFLDGWFHTAPALSLIGIFAGTAAGIAEILMLITRQEKNAADNGDNGAD